MSLEKHARQLVRCTRCPLRENATCPVPGIGSEEATYFLIGEAPGKSEDKDGVPFVGASGKRLNRLLALAQIDINDCYLTNVVKCWPPKVRGKQRAPKKSERLACWPWLKQELQLVQPKIIIPLGAVPLSLFTDVGIKQLHGTAFSYELELDEDKERGNKYSDVAKELYGSILLVK